MQRNRLPMESTAMSIDKHPSSPILVRFKQDLQLKGLAPRSQQAYCRAGPCFQRIPQPGPRQGYRR